jgi:hypothetical protein
MAENRTGFLGLLDMAGVLIEGLDPGPRATRGRRRVEPAVESAGDAPERRLSAGVTATAPGRDARSTARSLIAGDSAPGAPPGATAAPGPKPHVIEAIDSETGAMTWIVVHGAARAECSSPAMAEQIRSALAGR